MKKLIIVLAVASLLLGACGESGTAATPSQPGPWGSEFAVSVVDVNGRKVTCVVWDGYRAGGISCDWANAK